MNEQDLIRALDNIIDKYNDYYIYNNDYYYKPQFYNLYGEWEVKEKSLEELEKEVL